MQAKQWLHEALFWLHFFVILGGVLMGLVLPWWLALTAIVAHRVHLKLFDGCALSRLQKKTNSLAANQDYLQDLGKRLFNYDLPKQYVKTADRLIVATSLLVVLMAAVGLGGLVIALVTVLFAGFGGIRSWRMLQPKPTTSICAIDNPCEDAKDTRFSSLGGIPVELLGVGYFGVLAALQVLLALNGFQPLLLQQIVAGLLVAGVCSSVFFIIVQAQVLGTLCRSCMTVHGASFSLAVVQVVRLFA